MDNSSFWQNYLNDKDDKNDASYLVVEVDHVVLDGDVALHVLHFSMNDDDNLYDDWMTK